MPRILHTSDWHLGASLEGRSRDADHAHMLDWLARTIHDQHVEVLVVCGDVFDQAHPPAEAQRLYYRFLSRVSRLDCLQKVVIVGGNHDSAARLEAPREVLEELSVHVVGGLGPDPSDWSRCLCVVPELISHGGGDSSSKRPTSGAPALVVVAVPFVHEYRLGVRPADAAQSATLAAAMRKAFANLYGTLATQARRLAGNDYTPIVATGHLACVGADPLDAPAEVHLIGTVGGVPLDVLPPQLDYVALGHIHRSYRVGDSRAWYSGSPITLSLREARSPRTVLLVDLDDAGSMPRVTPLVVPQVREVLEVRGRPSEVADQLRSLCYETPMGPLVVARVTVDRFEADLDARLRAALTVSGPDGPELVRVEQHRAEPEHSGGVHVGEPVITSLRNLAVEEVFRRLCSEQGEPVDDELIGAFRLLAQEAEREVSEIPRPEAAPKVASPAISKNAPPDFREDDFVRAAS